MKAFICWLRGIWLSCIYLQPISGHHYEVVGDLPFDRLGFGDLKCKHCGHISHGDSNI